MTMDLVRFRADADPQEVVDRARALRDSLENNLIAGHSKEAVFKMYSRVVRFWEKRQPKLLRKSYREAALRVLEEVLAQVQESPN
jgi:hypothetical protein